jgi:TRAP transporter TAXI family solute receptor
LANLVAGLNRALPDASVALQPTSGSVVVTSAIQAGSGEVGLAQADVVYLAYRKETSANAYHGNLRGVAVGALNRLCIFVRRESPIHTVSDLRGRRVAIAPDGTAGALLTRMVLDAYGIAYADLHPMIHQIGDMGRFFAEEQLDAMIMVGAFDPNTLIAPLNAADLRLLSIDREGTTRLRSQYPFIKPATVLALEVAGLPADVPTIGTDSLIICRRDLPEDLVYRLTKQLLTQADSQNVLSIDPDTAPATPIPLHPGAARYYRELQLLK